jgi:F-box-like
MVLTWMIDDTDQLYQRGRAIICKLPDNVLLEIFEHHLLITSGQPFDAWHTLVHVCRQWRSVVFAPPRRLSLKLLYTNKRAIQKTPDMWPALPIVIEGNGKLSQPEDAKNILTALMHHDRVCKIKIGPIPVSLLKRIRGITEPFPALTSLWLWSQSKKLPIIPPSFLGASAPRLQELILSVIPFPALPKLLSSTTDLVRLELWSVPYSGYISPEAMVTGLSSLAKLETLVLLFQSPRSTADRVSRGPPPTIRAILPAFTSFDFKGDSEYLEDIVSRIDTPLLNDIAIRFFNQLVFDTPLLSDFICRTETFKPLNQARISVFSKFIHITLSQEKRQAVGVALALQISCSALDWQLSSLGQICSTALPHTGTLRRLEIRHEGRLWQDDMDSGQWLELLQPFTSVKDLILSNKVAGLVVPALQALNVERVTDVLPALRNLLLDSSTRSGAIQEPIAQYVATRQLSGHPVAVVYQR